MGAASAAVMGLAKMAKAQFNTGAFWKGSSGGGGPPATGQLWFFGDFETGQAGVDKQTLWPCQITTGSWLSMSVYSGGKTGMAIKSDNTLWGWGDNYYSQIPTGIYGQVSSPVQIAGTWSSVSVGYKHVLGIKPDGTLWAWGYNNLGEIPGAAGGVSITSMIQIAGSWSQVAAGYESTYGIMTDGTLWASGNNGWGQIGDGTQTNRNTLTQIAGSWSQVSAHESYFTAIKSDGTFWSCGYNLYFDGPRSSVSQIFTGTDYLAVAAGLNELSILKTDQTLWCVGQNQYGQLGNGATVDLTSPVQVPGTWTKTAVGQYNTYGIRSDGTLWSWGFGFYGALGIGYTIMGQSSGAWDRQTLVGKSSPVQIAGSWSQVFAGNNCAFGIKTDGTIWAWGKADINNASDTRLGFAPNFRSPQQIPGSWSQIAANPCGDSLMAMKTDGTIWSWGNDEMLQLGHLNTAQNPLASPVQVPGTYTTLIWALIMPEH